MSRLKNTRPEPKQRSVAEASDDAILLMIQGMNWPESHDVYFQLPQKARRRLRDGFINDTVMSHDMFMDMYDEIRDNRLALFNAVGATTIQSPLLSETDIVDHLIKRNWLDADTVCDLALRMDDQTDPRIANILAESIRPDDIGHVLSQRNVSEEVLHILRRKSRLGGHDLIPFLFQKHIPPTMFKDVVNILIQRNSGELLIQMIHANPRIALDVWKATDDPSIRSAVADHIEVLQILGDDD